MDKRLDKRLILVVLLTTLIGVLTAENNIIASYLSSLINSKQFQPFAFPLFWIIIILIVPLTLWLNSLLGNIEQSAMTKYRRRMLARVRTQLEDELQQSLRKKNGRLILKLMLAKSGKHVQQLLSNNEVMDIYKQADGKLLILGKPGTGKTVLLLELALGLLTLAEQDETYPIPVYLNLSSWSSKQPFSQWLKEAINDRYDVSQKLSKNWIDNDQLLLLLDGFDEITPEARKACAKGINNYQKEHSFTSIVVCSRDEEYSKQKIHLAIPISVTVLPLTIQQVEEVLSKSGGELAQLRVALQKDAELRELITTPLMLDVIVLAYQDMPIKELLVPGSIERWKRVFATYVNRMLSRRKIKLRFTQQEAFEWLTWLAKQMRQRNQTVFYIERLQPDWLLDKKYYRLSLACLGPLIVGIPIALVGWLVAGPYALIEGGIPGALYGWLIFNGTYDLFNSFGSSKKEKEKRKKEVEISPAEALGWSWINIKEGINAILFSGILGGLISGIGIAYKYDLEVKLITAIFGMIIGILFIGLSIGISGQMLVENTISKPNQGIRRSAWNCVIIGLTFTLTAVIIGILLSIAFGVSSEFRVALIGFGMAAGLFVGLLKGGLACVKHIVLRVCLWRAKFMPLNYPHFLNYATDSLLLNHVGGGYKFAHPRLQEYFIKESSISSMKDED